MKVVIEKSTRKHKKWQASDSKRTVHFGQASAQDFTQHGDETRRKSYIQRHSNEDWSKSNMMSPAFMSRWVLWEKKSIAAAIRNLNEKYTDVSFHLK
jgi:hypothetical protein